MEILKDNNWDAYLKSVNKKLNKNNATYAYLFLFHNKGIDTRHTHFIKSKNIIIGTIIDLMVHMFNAANRLYYNLLVFNVPDLSWRSNYILTKIVYKYGA